MSFASRSRFAKSSMSPSLSNAPNSPQNFAYFVRVLGEALEHVEDAARQRRAHRADRLVLLQQLARDVERELARVDDAANEAQVQRQELRRLIRDEHALHVQLDALRRLAVPEIERRRRRHVQQARVLALAFDAVVAPDQRLVGVVRDVLVELDVLVVLDLGARPRPERLRAIDRFLFARRRRPSGRGTRCGRSTCE